MTTTTHTTTLINPRAGCLCGRSALLRRLPMSEARPQPIDEFRERLEAGDRWIEFARGRLIRLTPPDEMHGNVVRNVSKALGRYFRKHPVYYPCFELALVVDRTAPTIRTPAISCFRIERGLEEMDRLVTETVPDLVIEVASSNDRREAMSERIRGYQTWSVPHIWVFDPESQHAHVFSPGETPRMLKETETLSVRSLFPEFSLLVGDVFRDPAWLTRKPEAEG